MEILILYFFCGLKRISLGISLWLMIGLGLIIMFLVELFFLILLCCDVLLDVEILGSILELCSFSCDVDGSC